MRSKRSTARSRRTKTTTAILPESAFAALEQSLSETRDRLEQITEDRDNQVAIIEAAEIEHSVVVAQLEEARERIRALEQKQTSSPAQESPHPTQPEEDDEIDFEEHEAEGDPEDLDDVDSIYQRLDDPRVRRQELDHERLDRESEVGDEPFWNICPKCGDRLDEVETEDLKIDRCEGCSGLFLDHGEVELILMISRGPDGIQRIRSALQI